MATEVGVRELKNRASALIEQVERGEVVTVTKRGKEVARLIPVKGKMDPGLARMVAEGKVRWSGREFELPTPVKLRGKGKTGSDYIIEERDRKR